MDMMKKIKSAKDYIESKAQLIPEIAVILGSGLGPLALEIEEAVAIPYKDIPGFPESTVEGHAGELVLGKLEGKRVLVMNGRFHAYEGYSLQEVTFPVRVMKALGIGKLIVTNACGGLNPDLYPGALMIIDDHINFIGSNPLIGRNNNELGPRFPDMSRAYDREMVSLTEKMGVELGIKLEKGVYCAISGPSYMTPAELRILTRWGADAVGMSTVPEVIVANHMSMKVLGIACVTDMAIPDQLQPLTHEIVMETANRTRPQFISLVKGIVRSL